MAFDFELSGNGGVLTLQGDLTVGQADALKVALLGGMAQADSVTVNLDQVTSIDLSCLQVFCSAHRTYDTEKKVLSFNRQGLVPFEKTLRLAGFIREKACDLNPNTACLWGGGAQ
jgi:anti-anti-sigma regulatory factor